MPTLICPDVHERLDTLRTVEEKFFPAADRVVMLGDFFDSFSSYDEQRIAYICDWLNSHANDPKITLLGGNHDFHYIFDHDAFHCSGYDPRKKFIIKERLTPDAVRAFKLYTKVGPYTVSHAGFCEATLPYCKPEVCNLAMETARNGEFDPIFGAGRARGGWQRLGGPTWLDFSWEFEHIDGFPQIVGHTQGSEIRSKGNGREASYCIDTALRHVAWIDEDSGAIRFEDV